MTVHVTMIKEKRKISDIILHPEMSKEKMLENAISIIVSSLAPRYDGKTVQEQVLEVINDVHNIGENLHITVFYSKDETEPLQITLE